MDSMDVQDRTATVDSPRSPASPSSARASKRMRADSESRDFADAETAKPCYGVEPFGDWFHPLQGSIPVAVSVTPSGNVPLGCVGSRSVNIVPWPEEEPPLSKIGRLCMILALDLSPSMAHNGGAAAIVKMLEALPEYVRTHGQKENLLVGIVGFGKRCGFHYHELGDPVGSQSFGGTGVVENHVMDEHWNHDDAEPVIVYMGHENADELLQTLVDKWTLRVRRLYDPSTLKEGEMFDCHLNTNYEDTIRFLYEVETAMRRVSDNYDMQFQSVVFTDGNPTFGETRAGHLREHVLKQRVQLLQGEHESVLNAMWDDVVPNVAASTMAFHFCAMGNAPNPADLATIGGEGCLVGWTKRADAVQTLEGTHELLDQVLKPLLTNKNGTLDIVFEVVWETPDGPAEDVGSRMIGGYSLGPLVNGHDMCLADLPRPPPLPSANDLRSNFERTGTVPKGTVLKVFVNVGPNLIMEVLRYGDQAFDRSASNCLSLRAGPHTLGDDEDRSEFRCGRLHKWVDQELPNPTFGTDSNPTVAREKYMFRTTALTHIDEIPERELGQVARFVRNGLKMREKVNRELLGAGSLQEASQILDESSRMASARGYSSMAARMSSASQRTRTAARRGDDADRDVSSAHYAISAASQPAYE